MSKPISKIYQEEIKTLSVSTIEPILMSIIQKNGIEKINDKELDVKYSLARTFTDKRLILLFKKNEHFYENFQLHMPTFTSFQNNNINELKKLNNLNLLYTHEQLYFGIYGKTLDNVRKFFKKEYVDIKYNGFPENYYTFNSSNYDNLKTITTMLDNVVKYAEENMKTYSIESQNDLIQGMKDIK